MENRYCHYYKTVADSLQTKLLDRDAKVSEMLARRDVPALKAYASAMRAHFKRKVPLHYERSLLNPQVTGEFVFDSYKLSKIILEAMPGYHLPVHLYAPLDQDGKHPVLLVPMGHYLNGKFIPENQIMCANFAMQGFVVATFDPVGQGERDMFPNMIRNEKQMGYAAVDEHMHVGIPLNMLGENLTSLFIWDCVRVIDYLCSLPYADSSRVGVTGQSGGGAQSGFLGALDDRVTAASPIHSLTKSSFGIRGGIGDSEQSVYGVSDEFGFDRDDVLFGIFPKKLMINIGGRDSHMPTVRYVEQELSRLYEMAGNPQDFSVRIADCEHEITKETREIAYTWFNHVFCGTDGPIQEREAAVLDIEALRCFPDGFTTCTAFDIAGRRLALARERAAADPRPMLEQVKAVLGGFADSYTVDRFSDSANQSEFIVHTTGNGYVVCRLKKGVRPHLRVVLDQTGEAEIPDDGAHVLSLTPLGIDYADNKREFDFNVETTAMIAAFYNGQVVFRNRLVQVLTAVAYGKSIVGDAGVSFAGSRQGGLLALCAALYCPSATVDAYCTAGSLERYFENVDAFIAETSIIPGLVNICDIPDLAALTGAKVTFVDPLDEQGKVFSKEAALPLFGGKAAVRWTKGEG